MAGWRPQPGPQKALIDCPVSEILFGGARGGGKSDGVLGKWAIKERRHGKRFNAVLFRKEMPQADDIIERAREIFEPLGARFYEQKRQFIMPNLGRIRFRPLERTADADKYQGQNLTDVAIEEAGIYAEPNPIDRLWGALRSAYGVKAQMILTANPGGAGQQWIKERYIDPEPMGNRILTATLPNGQTHNRVFIPSKVQDNRALLANDPDYIKRLYLVGSEQLVKAWLDGDWNAVEGAFFDCWSDRLILRPFKIPAEWTRFRSFDWGSYRPFSVGWWAVASDNFQTPEGDIIPRGAMVRYREWYGRSEPNVGLKLTAEQVAEGIKEREKEDTISYSVADPSIFKEDGGPSIGERMGDKGVFFQPADNTRVAGVGAMGGWDQMRARMIGDERPMIYCFNTCTDSIRTIPVLQHDDSRPEDLDTEAEDHAADDWRYACMSRPYTPAAAQETRKKDRYDRAFDKEEESWLIV